MKIIMELLESSLCIKEKLHKTKNEKDKFKMLAEINSIQLNIKEICKYDNYYKEIGKQSSSKQDNKYLQN